jgi:hypothetical protein
MRIFACCLLALATTTGFAPSSTELRHRYGPPDSERRNADGVLEAENFTMQPGISLTVEYGSDARSCQMHVSHTLELEVWAQHPFSTDTILSKVLEELAPLTARREKFGERTKDSVLVTEYENILVTQTAASGVLDGKIFFKREGCPKAPNPFVFSPPADPETVRRLTPSAVELRKRFGVADSGLPIGDVFLIGPDITIVVKYGSDHLACSIAIEPADLGNPYIPKEKVSELLDELAPAAMRGREISGYGEFRPSCLGVGMAVYENVFIGRWPNYCVPEHKDTEKGASIQFKRDACPNPYASEKGEPLKSR